MISGLKHDCGDVSLDKEDQSDAGTPKPAESLHPHPQSEPSDARYCGRSQSLDTTVDDASSDLSINHDRKSNINQHVIG